MEKLAAYVFAGSICVFELCDAYGAEVSKVSAETMAECKASSKSFVEISDCLAPTEVAIKTVEAFASIYPPDAQTILARCKELNQKSVSAAACITTAVDAAVKLKQSLPEGQTLDDPVFLAASDAVNQEKLQAATADARRAFPDILFWGGGSYMPYK